MQNIDNYQLNLSEVKLSNYLSIFEAYGEFILKSKTSLDSSVG